MAVFTLDSDQRRLLADCISIGYEGALVEDDLAQNDDTIASMMDELEASNRTIEITIMPVGAVNLHDRVE